MILFCGISELIALNNFWIPLASGAVRKTFQRLSIIHSPRLCALTRNYKSHCNEAEVMKSFVFILLGFRRSTRIARCSVGLARVERDG